MFPLLVKPMANGMSRASRRFPSTFPRAPKQLGPVAVAVMAFLIPTLNTLAMLAFPPVTLVMSARAQRPIAVLLIALAWLGLVLVVNMWTPDVLRGLIRQLVVV